MPINSNHETNFVLNQLNTLISAKCPASLADGVVTLEDGTQIAIEHFKNALIAIQTQHQATSDVLAAIVRAAGLVKDDKPINGDALFAFGDHLIEMLESQYHAQAPAKSAMPNAETRIRQFLAVLAKADSVSVDDSPLLSSWDLDEFTAEADNEILCFSWVDEEGLQFRVKINEEGMAGGFWKKDSFVCLDAEGDRIEIRLNKHVPVMPDC